MRVISQDWKINCPYDYTIFMVDGNNVVAMMVDSPFPRVMATYSSEEIAAEAMKRLNRHWEPIHGSIFVFPSEEKLCADSSQ